MKCCLCEGEIKVVNGWGTGNNAEPLSSGRCCDDCNQNLVIPARLLEVASRGAGVRLSLRAEPKSWPVIRSHGYENREDSTGSAVHAAVRLADGDCEDCDLIGALDDLEAVLEQHSAFLDTQSSARVEAAEANVAEAFGNIQQKLEGE
jgi:hypothetical protein